MKSIGKFSIVFIFLILFNPISATASKGCSYYKSGKPTMAKENAYVTFAGEKKQCVNGNWIAPSNKTNNQQDKAVSIVCFNYQYRSCEVMWSSGKRTLGSEYGIKSGGVVDSTTYIDLGGQCWIIKLYAGGGIKYSGWC